MILEELNSIHGHIWPASHPSCSKMRKTDLHNANWNCDTAQQHLETMKESDEYPGNSCKGNSLIGEDKQGLPIYGAVWQDIFSFTRSNLARYKLTTKGCSYLSRMGRIFWIFCSCIKHRLQHSCLHTNIQVR